MSEPLIYVEHTDEWLTLWFNQPERRNPLSDALTHELHQALDDAAVNPAVRGVTLRGRGGFFCAGADLAGFRRMAAAKADDVVAMSLDVADLFRKIDGFPKLTVALVEGAAMAGGLGMVCCCDVSLGTQSARFGFSETQIGITPAQIARYVIAKVGFATGRRLMLTASRFDGIEAGRLGLLDSVAEDVNELESIEANIRRDVLRCAPGAVAATKLLIRRLRDLDDAAIPKMAAENFAGAFLSDEGREGVASFVEKRKPYWNREG